MNKVRFKFFGTDENPDATRQGTRVRKILNVTLGALAFLFSFYLMFHTFSYDSQTHSILIASKAWSDFGAHIPMIRSFSYGPNLTRLFHGQPIESPLYPGEPIRYHFGFYALVGLLEKLGIRIDYALNIPSAAGFFLLLLCIFQLSYFLFNNYWVSLLSVFFFLFNGSLSFMRFFQHHTIGDIVTNSRFPAFGPWDGNTITAFWNLNIYTNQRHLALSYAIILVILYVLLKKKNPMLIALCASFLLFINYPAFAIVCIFLLWIFLTQKQLRIPLVMAGLLTVPALFFLSRVAHVGSDIVWQPGYLSTGNIVQFWFDNLGLHTLLIPLGIILAPKKIRHLFLVPLLVLFIIPNLWRFSPDMINNHKFFNFFLIIGNMFSAYAIIKIGQIRHIGRISLICLIFLLTLSGIIDFFPIINDTKGAITDIASNPDARYILQHTPPNAVIANSTWFYHPASIAGRDLYAGYTYFTWSYGYNQADREQRLKDVYMASTKQDLCRLLFQDNISYVELNPHHESYLTPNMTLWNALPPIYENPDTHVTIYARNTICE